MICITIKISITIVKQSVFNNNNYFWMILQIEANYSGCQKSLESDILYSSALIDVLVANN